LVPVRNKPFAVASIRGNAGNAQIELGKRYPEDWERVKTGLESNVVVVTF